MMFAVRTLPTVISHRHLTEYRPVTKEDVDTLKYDWLTDNVRWDAWHRGPF